MTENVDEDTKTNIAIVPSERLLIAEKDFILAVKRAKRDGVDVSGIFLEVREQAMLAWVRMFGLSLGIVWIFLCPILIPLYQIYCFKAGMPYALSEWFYYWPCIVGLVSILSFGFNLVDPRTLQRITGKTPEPTPLEYRKLLIHSDYSDGDV